MLVCLYGIYLFLANAGNIIIFKEKSVHICWDGNKEIIIGIFQKLLSVRLDSKVHKRNPAKIRLDTVVAYFWQRCKIYYLYTERRIFLQLIYILTVNIKIVDFGEMWKYLTEISKFLL